MMLSIRNYFLIFCLNFGIQPFWIDCHLFTLLLWTIFYFTITFHSTFLILRKWQIWNAYVNVLSVLSEMFSQTMYMYFVYVALLFYRYFILHFILGVRSLTAFMKDTNHFYVKARYIFNCSCCFGVFSVLEIHVHVAYFRVCRSKLVALIFLYLVIFRE